MQSSGELIERTDNEIFTLYKVVACYDNYYKHQKKHYQGHIKQE